jgi:hypothetical protein
MMSMLGSHVRRNLVAYLALFVALGGTAVAAKPMITGADIVDGSVTGVDVSDTAGGTLTGADILESSLGKVGDADTLDTKDSSDFLGAAAKASDADQLDGKDSTDFLPATTLVRLTRNVTSNLTIPARSCSHFLPGPFPGGNVGDPVFVSSSFPAALVLTASTAVDFFGTGDLFSDVGICNPTDSDIATTGATVQLLLVSG